MLNTERIRIMTKLNRYENGPERDHIRINGIYRSDYIGMALLRNFFYVTIGYILILAVCGLYHFDYLTEEWFKMDLNDLIRKLILCYIVLLIGYSAIVYIIYSMRYHKMKKHIKAYDRELKNLEELYSQNDRREVE